MQSRYKAAKVRTIHLGLDNYQEMAEVAAQMKKAALKLRNDQRMANRNIREQVEYKFLRPLMSKLKEYPPERNHDEKVNWKTEKQWRYMMWASRKGIIDLPTKRTNHLADGWKYTIRFTPSGLRVVIENTAEYSRYVVGDIVQTPAQAAMKEYLEPMQPFHQNRWKPAYETIAPVMQQLQDFVESKVEESYDFLLNFGST